MAKKKKKAKKVLCHACKGLCCRYMALPIETPKDRGDFDDIRWYLAHKDVSVFVEDGDWYINIKNKCRHISEKDHRCRIYEKRPRICRGYKTVDCEFTSDEYDYSLHFTNDKQMEEYMKVKFDNNKSDHPINSLKKRKKKARSKK
ncbi:MAG: YkgJ family cysteine cluster protein [Phycisphaerae bacterium]|nr:YkgJ family cysteine cluster protein [Phycisphaerae bacterium]